MKGTGNSFSTLFQKIYFMMLPSCGLRSKYIMKHSHQFKYVGEGVFWQSRKFPSDPELISLGNNVLLAAGVSFINHDIVHALLNLKYHTKSYAKYEGCIDIGDNVMIGANTIILPDVKIGSNVIIGAGSIITKDIPSNSVAVGVPAKVIGKFEDVVEKRKHIITKTPNDLWESFNLTHKLC